MTSSSFMLSLHRRALQLAGGDRALARDLVEGAYRNFRRRHVANQIRGLNITHVLVDESQLLPNEEGPSQ